MRAFEFPYVSLPTHHIRLTQSAALLCKPTSCFDSLCCQQPECTSPSSLLLQSPRTHTPAQGHRR